MNISVVIPVLNEMACLPATIASVRTAIKDAEIIAVDGGSNDGSREWLLEQHDIQTITESKGKGLQQNAGGFAARGDLLLFLHADCQLPENAEQELYQVMSDGRIAGGCFYVRFNETRPLTLRMVSFGINIRTRLFCMAYGDQALFIRKEIFHQIGGFPEWPLFEDSELVRRFRRRGAFACIASPVTISARRYLALGVCRTAFLVHLLKLAFRLGVSPARLKTWFADIRITAEPTSSSASSMKVKLTALGRRMTWR